MEKVSIGHSGKTSCESEHPHSSHESWQEKLIIKMLKDAGTLDDVYKAAKMKDRNFSIPKDDDFSEIPMTIGELFYFLPKDFISERGGSWDDRLDDPEWKEIIENSSKIPGYQKQVKTFRPYPEYEENLRKRAEHNGVYCTTFHPNYSHAKWARITDYGKYPSVPKPNKYNFFGSGQDWGGGMTKKQYNEGCLINIIALLLLIMPLVIFI
tara:strand:+ start:2835 stop:3464 length:630 start_codon:yes stop_codon:yes gene_type:complete